MRFLRLSGQTEFVARGLSLEDLEPDVQPGVDLSDDRFSVNSITPDMTEDEFLWALENGAKGVQEARELLRQDKIVHGEI